MKYKGDHALLALAIQSLLSREYYQGGGFDPDSERLKYLSYLLCHTCYTCRSIREDTGLSSIYK